MEEKLLTLEQTRIIAREVSRAFIISLTRNVKDEVLLQKIINDTVEEMDRLDFSDLNKGE